MSRPILSIRLAEFCTSTATLFVQYFLPPVIVIVLILIGIILCLYHKEPICIWLYSHPSLRRLLFITDLNTKDYDVFVSYSDLDSEYVEREVIPGLEHGKDIKYKCMFHKRDFMPGNF